MLQVLSLSGAIRDAEIRITMHTLAALSGMKPIRVFDHCIVWVPTNSFSPVLAAGEVNQIEQYRITTSSSLVDSNSRILDAAGFDEDADLVNQRKWELRICEVPEAGKRKVTSQSVLSSGLVEGGLEAFMKTLGFKFEHEYWINGYEFVFDDIVVRIHRICTQAAPKPAETVIDVDSSDMMAVDDQVLETGPTRFRPLSLLDKSGQWVIVASIDVKNLTDLESINKCTAQLEKFQAEMAGLFELKMPDRNSFDTRVKAR